MQFRLGLRQGGACLLVLAVCALPVPPVPGNRAAAGHPAAAGRTGAAGRVGAACAGLDGVLRTTIATLSGAVTAGAHDAWFVGSAYHGIEQPLALHYDGVHFSATLPVSDDTYTSGRLAAVAASGPANVWAVGALSSPPDAAVPLTVHFDGRRWQRLPFPVAAGSSVTLRGVAVGGGQAWAVGSRLTVAGGRETVSPLIGYWDGRRWLSSTVPVSSDASAELYAVAALSPRDVWAAGGSSNGPLMLHFDGRGWSAAALPILPPGAQEMHALTVLSADDVWAAGFYDANNVDRGGVGPVMLHWDGRTWTLNPRVHAAPLSYAAGVTPVAVVAASPRDIWAAGGGVAHWDGARWQTLALTRSIYAATLFAGRLLTVERGAPTTSPSAPAVEIRAGDGAAWQTLYRAAPVEPSIVIHGLAAATSTQAWAAGEVDSMAGSSMTMSPLLAEWRGAQDGWRRIPEALARTYMPGTPSPLQAVAGRSANDLWATSGGQIEHWDGQVWQIVANAPLNRSRAQINALAAVSAGDVWTVGDPGSFKPAFIEHWDGARWSAVPGPGLTGSMMLRSVDAASSRSAWAVGVSHFIRQRPLAEHWDGARWRIAPVPDFGPHAVEGWLNGVAVAGREAWAVGASYDGTATSALIEHWDGTRWHDQELPDLGPGWRKLSAVTALAPNDVWAAGSDLLHWDGRRWQRVPDPLPVASYTSLASHGPGTLWAAATLADGGSIVLRHTGSCWEAAPVPTAMPLPRVQVDWSAPQQHIDVSVGAGGTYTATLSYAGVTGASRLSYLGIAINGSGAQTVALPPPAAGAIGTVRLALPLQAGLNAVLLSARRDSPLPRLDKLALPDGEPAGAGAPLRLPG